MIFLKNSKSSVIFIAGISCMKFQGVYLGYSLLWMEEVDAGRDLTISQSVPTLSVAGMYLTVALQSSSWLHFWMKVYQNWALLLRKTPSEWVNEWMEGHRCSLSSELNLHKRQPWTALWGIPTLLGLPSKLPICPSALLWAAPSHLSPAPQPSVELEAGMRGGDGAETEGEYNDYCRDIIPGCSPKEITRVTAPLRRHLPDTCPSCVLAFTCFPFY